MCVCERVRACVEREKERVGKKGASKFAECLFVVLRRASECECKWKCKLS